MPAFIQQLALIKLWIVILVHWSNKTSLVAHVMLHIIHRMDVDVLVVGRWSSILAKILEHFVLIQICQLDSLHICPL